MKFLSLQNTKEKKMKTNHNKHRNRNSSTLSYLFGLCELIPKERKKISGFSEENLIRFLWNLLCYIFIQANPNIFPLPFFCSLCFGKWPKFRFSLASRSHHLALLQKKREFAIPSSHTYPMP